MKYEEKIVDRQVGRNGDLFATTIGQMESKEERYPYLRILVSIVEQAHPEWNQAPNKDSQISLLIFRMSRGSLDREEVAEIVQLRDAERGYNFIEKKSDPSSKGKADSKDEKEKAAADTEKSPAEGEQDSAETDNQPTEADQAAGGDEEKSVEAQQPETQAEATSDEAEQKTVESESFSTEVGQPSAEENLAEGESGSPNPEGDSPSGDDTTRDHEA